MTEIKKRILFFVQLPPPVHGVSIMNQIIVHNTEMQETFDTKVLPIKFSEGFQDLRRKGPLKIIKAVILYFELYKYLKNFKFNLVYFSFMPTGIGFFRDFFFLLLIKRFRVKIILHLHNRGINRNAKNLLYRHLYNFVFSNTTIIHLSARLIAEEFRCIHPKNCSFYVLQNTCHPFLSKKKLEKRSTLDILFFSNIFPEKGYRIALETIQKIIIDYPSVRLHIYGQPFREKYKQEIERFIYNNNLQQFIKFYGAVFGEEKTKAFLNSDIFFFPTWFEEECFPLVILEAMAAGLPVISSSIGAIPDIITNGENGYIVLPDDKNAFYEKLKILIQSEDLRRRMGQKSLELYNENYTLPIFEQNELKLLKQILGE